MNEPWWRKYFQPLSTWFRPRRPRLAPQPAATNDSLPLDAEVLQGLVSHIFTTQPVELNCDECYEQVDCFAELVLAGKNAAEAMPLVQDHLDRCHECRDEFEALLAALRDLA